MPISLTHADNRIGEPYLQVDLSKVVAVVQVQQGHEFDLQEFEKICRSNLSGYKLPRAVYLATEVKRSPAGKADYRWAKAYAAEHEPLSAIEA